MHAHMSFPPGRGESLTDRLAATLSARRILGGMPESKVVLRWCRASPLQLRELEEASGQPVEVTGEPDPWGVSDADVEGPGSSTPAVDPESEAAEVEDETEDSD